MRAGCRSGKTMSDFECDMFHAPAGLLVQGEGCIFRCSQCDAPGPATLLTFIGDRLTSRYRAVLLSRDSKELSVVAEGNGKEILPQVLAAASARKFVWLKPL